MVVRSWRKKLPATLERYRPAGSSTPAEASESKSYLVPAMPGQALNELPQPQVVFTFGLLNLNPAPSMVST